MDIISQGGDFIQVNFDTPWSQPENTVVAELSRRFSARS
ncbi:TPA: hypothetical protein IBK74_004557 [Escherichia coli]|nr:hypothetical protein [Escherichia coli]